MTSAEIAAYIGAAAWVPQIARWLHRWLTRPILTIVPERNAELGFTSLGPLFNVRMAFSADFKDVRIDDLELHVVHQDGEAHVFRWSGMRESLGETRDSAGVQQQTLTKDHVPIALKVGTASLTEKFVRHDEPRYNDVVRPLMQTLVAHFNYLKQTSPNFVAATLQSKEFLALVGGRNDSFWWKPGNYEVTIVPSCSKAFSQARDRYRFVLEARDVDRLRQNVQSLKTDLENTIRSNLPDFQATPITWNWAYPELTRIAD